MKREQIKEILTRAGLAEDKAKEAVESIFAEHGKDIDAEKAKTTAKENELSAAKAADSATRSALSKFEGREGKVGGIIYDITSNEASIEEICQVIQSRMDRAKEPLLTDLIFIKDKKIAYIFRYKKANP